MLTLTSTAQPSKQLQVTAFAKGITLPTTQVIDVRTPQEYAAGHIPNAILANWNSTTDFAAAIQVLDKAKPIYLYCQLGGRSAKALAWLTSKGYKQVYELQGGLTAWLQAGKPLAK